MPVEGSVDTFASDMLAANGGKPLTVVFVLGGPGSGKGTQCERIVKEYEFTHLSTGDLLRKVKDSDSREAEEIKELMRQGKLVPNSILIDLLKKAMIESKGHRFLIDGFPRELEQAKLFEDTLHPCAFALNFECSDDLLVSRCLKRGQDSGRVDDNEETIKKRLKTFHDQTVPVVGYLDKLGKAKTIDASRGIDDIWNDVSTIMDKCCQPFEDQMRAVNGDKPLQVVFVLGGPGSGKGTQCERIVKEYGFTHLSTGDLLRKVKDSDSPDAAKIKDIMQRGELVPNSILIDLLKDAMLESKGYRFLIDGFPRELEQAVLFEKTLCSCEFGLNFECSDEVLVSRCLKRGQTSGRVDDNEETIQKRLNTFHSQTVPVVKHLKEADKAKTIDAARDLDAVWQDVKAVMDTLQ